MRLLKHKSTEEKRQRPRRYATRQGRLDMKLLGILLLLIAFGVFMVYSASAPYALDQFGDAQYYFRRDLVFASISIIMMLLVSRIDYNLYRRYYKSIYVAAFLLGLAVFFPGIAKPINGARRWIGIGSVSIMPSDFMKIASTIFLAAMLSKRSIQDNGDIKTAGRVIALIAVTIIPVFLQPNFSAVVVLAFTLFTVYILGGMRRSHLLIFIGCAAVLAVIAFWPYPGNYRLERLLIVFDPSKDAHGSGWQLLQSLYAVSSGGLAGVGFGHSRQKYDYLADEPHNDFIYAVISEELGFIGAVLLIVAFVYLIYRALRIAGRARNGFGRLLGYGLTIIVAFQAMINIGVAIGLSPPTGITLPFISYGGSSLMAMSVLAGVLLNISRDSQG